MRNLDNLVSIVTFFNERDANIDMGKIIKEARSRGYDAVYYGLVPFKNKDGTSFGDELMDVAGGDDISAAKRMADMLAAFIAMACSAHGESPLCTVN